MIDLSLHVLVGGNWIKSGLLEGKKGEIRQIQVNFIVLDFYLSLHVLSCGIAELS